MLTCSALRRSYRDVLREGVPGTETFYVHLHADFAVLERRMTVVRLTAGRLVIYSAIALDEPSMREMLRIVLRRDGYDVLMAEDGTEALKLIDEHTIDLVDVWGTSSKDVWAASSHGGGVHFNGAKWSRASRATTPRRRSTRAPTTDATAPWPSVESAAAALA